MPFFRFEPIYQPRVWGGRALTERLGRVLPAGERIGESWEIVDRPEAQSRLADASAGGLTLRELIATRAAEVMGPGWEPGRPFPILVKWLDCRERLSLQVHPPAAIAAQLGGEPKTENWFVAHAAPGAAVLAGLKPGVDAAALRAALAADAAETLIERHPTRTGDSLLISSGVLHAIDAGNFILEIQQNSDTTYRVYDWGRVGLDGRPRQLHIEQSLACLEACRAPTPCLRRAEGPDALLAECAEFRIRQVRLAPGATLRFAAREQPRILSVVHGSLVTASAKPFAMQTLEKGANVLLPYAESFEFAPVDEALVLVTEDFTHNRP